MQDLGLGIHGNATYVLFSDNLLFTHLGVLVFVGVFLVFGTARPKQWIVTIPSFDQWLATIEKPLKQA